MVTCSPYQLLTWLIWMGLTLRAVVIFWSQDRIYMFATDKLKLLSFTQFQIKILIITNIIYYDFHPLTSTAKLG